MKYTINEFASQIRNLYPNDYDDLTDEKLVELWLKKYPEDIEKIDFKIREPQNKSKNIIEHLVDIFLVSVLGIPLVFLLILGITYINDPKQASQVVENVKNRINGLGFDQNSNSSNNQNSVEIPGLNESKTNLNEIYSQCFSLSDILIEEGIPNLYINPNEELILQNHLISKEGDKIVLTNIRITINDIYSANYGENTLVYTGSYGLFTFQGQEKILTVDGNFFGNSSIPLNGFIADENGNRFDYFKTKVLKIEFSCDQFSLERNYN